MHDANLHSRASRSRLRQQRKPHWCTLRPGALHLGYSRPRRGRPGIWTVRTYRGSVRTLAPGRRGGQTPYLTKRLPGVADDYEDANGTTVLSFAQAQDLALAPPAIPQSGGPLTVQGAIDDYVALLRDGGRERAAAETIGRMRVHVPPQLGATQVASLTPEQLRGWLADLARRLQTRRPGGDDAERRSRTSANRVLTVLRAALNHAYAESKVPSDAAWRRRVRPFKNVDVARVRWLTIEECVRLINACQGAFRALVQAALHTGARYGELTRLRVGDFDEDAGSVRVGKSKSGKPRWVHLTEEGAAFLRELTAGRRGTELMLPREDGEQWQKSDQQWRMRGAVERASIAPAISFHGLRHTYASLSIMSGVTLQVVAENLGHRDTRMCERYYGHLAQSHKRDMIRDHAVRYGVPAGAGRVQPLRQKRDPRERPVS
jgi:integrase